MIKASNIIQSFNAFDFASMISKYRNALMGFAIIWVIFTHCYKVISLPEILRFPIFGMGFGGVDIFMMLSGFGIYCSLSKNNNIADFYIKRIKRLLPIFPLLILYCFFAKITSFHKVIGFLTIQNFWTGETTVAYLPYLYFCYLLSPIFVELIDKSLKTVVQKSVFITILFMMSVPYWGSLQLIGIARIPIFFVGLCIGSIYINKQIINKKSVFIAILCSLISVILLIISYTKFYEYRIYYGLIFYCMSFFAPGFVFLLSYFLKNFSESNSVVVKKCPVLLEFLGKRTLEIFILDQFVISFMKDTPFLIHVCYSIIGGLLYHYLYAKIFNIYVVLRSKYE